MIKKLNRQFYKSYFQRYELVIPNAYFKGQSNEMDIAAVRKSGFLDEIEIKLSVADFNADFNKETLVFYKNKIGRRVAKKVNKHKLLRSGKLPCNYFYFFLSEKLAEQCDIPEYAGLITYKKLDKNRILLHEQQKPKRLHDNKLSLEQRFYLCKKIYYKYWR